jgi:outer membrane protein assembly factor BamE
MLTAYRAASAVSLAFCLVVAVSGCASKNPLIDEPASAQAKPAPATTAAAPVAATTAPAPVAAEKPAAAASTASGVQVSKERRLFGIFTPYRPDIQQGNFISREMVSQLKIGMTPDQVRFVLGTPLLTDIFHADRWDYVFRLEKRDGEVISSRVAVFFKDNRLARIDAGELPTEKDYISIIASTVPEAKPASSSK